MGILEQYCLLKGLLEIFLDNLQREEHNYLGYVEPTLILLRKLLI